MDNRTNFSNILLEKPSPQDDSPCYYSHTVEGFHVIAMDSQTQVLTWVASAKNNFTG
jgi:hypothetical protein